MKSYIGTKIIQAVKMTDLEFGMEARIYKQSQDNVKKYQHGASLLKGNSSFSPNDYDTISPAPKEGYKVMYPDGYISWSPASAFESAYRLITDAERVMV